jgi:hypothetical protein
MTHPTGTRSVPHGARATTRGVVFVHSCPGALTAHVEWALADVLGDRITLDWIPQPVLAGTLRAELSWTGNVGSAARMVSDLAGWRRLRFEVTEESTPATEGERFSVTPSLGIFRAVIGVHGDILVPEERLRAAVVRAAVTGTPVEQEIASLLGSDWDAELEPFRYAGENTPVRWLHQVVS